MKIQLQPSFILHRRPYSESSLIVDLFTKDYGRISLIAKGIKKSRTAARALLQPFIPLLISWQGKTELMTLTGIEPDGLAPSLKGDGLLAAFYLNELLVYLLAKQDAHPVLYQLYKETVLLLQTVPLQTQWLRLFEKKLLEEIGYGLQLSGEIETHQPFNPDDFYRYHPELGFKCCGKNEINQYSWMVFSGKSLIALAQEQLEDEFVLKEIKRLMRLAFKPILAGKELKSRELFVSE